MKGRAHILVSGRVQGVGYRSFAEGLALRHGLMGYCWNLSNGRVEVEVEGDKAVIESFVMDLWTGPPAARVKDVTIEWKDYTGRFSHFAIRF